MGVSWTLVVVLSYLASSMAAAASHEPNLTNLSSQAGTSVPFASNSTGPPSKTSIPLPELSTTASLTTQIDSSSITQLPSSTTFTSPRPKLDPSSQQDFDTLTSRRFSSIVGALSRANQIGSWLSSLSADGKWPDSQVDYTTGCEARRASWPAQEHWQRVLTMSGAWHGGLAGAGEYVKDDVLLTAILRAMGYWFSRDFTNPSCLEWGGTDLCPCANADNSLWNTNWFSNIILIPGLVGRTCLLLGEELPPAHLGYCTTITGRAYGTFDRFVNGLGYLTGANTLDVASVGIDQALLTSNVTLLSDAYRRVHQELSILDTVKADGIRRDGSFGQHGGILYNGNYGKDYSNDILDLEIASGGTQFSAGPDSRVAYDSLFEGNSWMIYINSVTGTLHWDFSALGRFISFPVVDNQATGNIKTNLSAVQELGSQWSSETLLRFAEGLSESTDHANVGNLVGNRMFYNNDYMVHRGPNYVSALKMYSSRTQNTECVNSQNPLGFHLTDGALRTYLVGNEYEDIAAAWDWNLIPGITVDYGATPLTCGTTQQTGIEAFVGGVSNGQIGVAVMRYTNPVTRALQWQKAWFFLEQDITHVTISILSSTSNASVYSVLDQRRSSGEVLIGDDTQKTASFTGQPPNTLWHGGVGYQFATNNSATLNVEIGEKSGNWSAIGTSTQPASAVNLFGAWLEHAAPYPPISYTVYPGTTSGEFIAKVQAGHYEELRNDRSVSAVYDSTHQILMGVFWDTAGGSLIFAQDSLSYNISTNAGIAFIYDLPNGILTVSDPSQSLTEVKMTLVCGDEAASSSGRGGNVTITLPQGGLAGSSVTSNIQL